MKRSTQVICFLVVLIMGAVPIVVFGPYLHLNMPEGKHMKDMHGRREHDTSLEQGRDDEASSADASSSSFSSAPETSSKHHKRKHEKHHSKHTKNLKGWKKLSLDDLSEGDMVGLRAPNGKWVSRVYDTESGTASLAEKTWKVHLSKSKHHTLRSWCGTYLGLNREAKLVAQGRAVSSEEKWDLIGHKHTILMKGVGRDGAGKFVGLVDAAQAKEGKGDLSCRFKEPTEGMTEFELFIREDCSDEDSCWGSFLEARQAAYVPIDPKQWLGDHTPLFGSPKPFNKSHSLYTESKLSYDRLLTAWKALDSPVKPFMFIEPHDHIGQEATTDADIPTFNEFEHHKKFPTQPTYRGLFSLAFEKGEELWGEQPEMVVYSNSDILYTSSLVSSLAASMRFAKVAKQQTEDARLLVVGQRINVDMPSDGGVDLKVSEARLDSTLARLAKKGQKYQTNAEDYFAVSRALFKWDKLPDFMVGGVAFDNWFVSKANRDKPVPNEVIAVDATDTIIAVHQNHGKGRKDSHLQPKSQYNRELAAKQGSWSKGRVVDTKYATMKTPWQEVLVVERRRLLFE